MVPHRGAWDAVRVPSTRSVVPLPTDFKGERFPLPAFTDSTAFVNIFPSLQINVTWDCAWWMRMLPSGPEHTTVTLGFCFPRATTELPDFPAKLKECVARHLTAAQWKQEDRERWREQEARGEPNRGHARCLFTVGVSAHSVSDGGRVLCGGRYRKRWHMAVSEDNAIACNQQRGVRSLFRRPDWPLPLD